MDHMTSFAPIAIALEVKGAKDRDRRIHGTC